MNTASTPRPALPVHATDLADILRNAEIRHRLYQMAAECDCCGLNHGRPLRPGEHCDWCTNHNSTR